MPNLFTKCLLLSGLGILFFLSSASLQHKGVTYDEPYYFYYGWRVLQGDTVRNHYLDNSKMPSSALNALVSFGQGDQISQILAGRYITIFFLLFLALLVFAWSRELYGIPAAFFSFFLCCFDPNLIAHGQLVTADVYGALAMLASLYSYWRFLTYGGLIRGVISAFILGLSQLAKYTSVSLFVLFLCIAVFKFLPELVYLYKAKDFHSLKNRIRLFSNYLCLFLFISLLIINLGFCFNRSFVELKDYQFKSSSFKSLQTVPFLSHMRVPVPYDYIQGLDLCKFADESGDTFANTYLFGQVHKREKGFKGYYFFTIFYKVPIATLVVILMALAGYWHTRRYIRFNQNECFLLLPIVFFLVYYDYFINMDIGIRQILFIFPLIYVFCGSLFTPWVKYPLWAKAVFLALFLYLAVSVFSYFPHFISYFNEFVFDRRMAYKILADSNLDWGGDEWYLKQYLKKYPESILSPPYPASGRIVIEVNDLVGLGKSADFLWLRDNFEPIDQIAYSYLVFDISPEQLRDYLHNSFHSSQLLRNK